MVPAGGLEPPHPAKDFGFKDHCVYHSAMRARAVVYHNPFTQASGAIAFASRCLRRILLFMQKAVEGKPANRKPLQTDKFKEAAREHGADEDEARWDERLKKIAKPKKEVPQTP